MNAPSADSVARKVQWTTHMFNAQEDLHSALEEIGKAHKYVGELVPLEGTQMRVALASVEYALQHVNRALREPTLPI